MRFPWQRHELDEEARVVRGKLAGEVVRNDRARNRLAERARDNHTSDMLREMFQRLDEARRE